MAAITGIQAFLELLAGCGTRYLFGNPGSTELPLNDALVGDDRFEYMLGLQEVPVVAMADGYAMASGKLGVVNLHASCGLGNALGMIYNACREGTPLLVTAGQQDRRLLFEEPILAGDLLGVARPWTKWAAEVQRVEDVPVAVRRAIQTALTPPTGPVFLSLPVDVQAQSAADLDLTPPRLPDRRVRPPVEALEDAAEVLLAAQQPAILAGSRVTEAGATEELVAVAEMLGAPVFSESGTTHGRLAFPCDHPLCGQGLPLWSPEVREALGRFDVLLVAGMDLLRQYIYHEPARAIPEHARIVHLDEDPWQLGKNYPVEVGLIGDTKTGLAELAALLESNRTAAQRAAAQTRTEQFAEQSARARAALVAKIEEQQAARPMTPLTFMHALARVLPPDVAVIEEAVTTTATTLERLGALENTDGYFGHRGWALGWGLGVQLAWPGRPVLGILGEGAALYGIQGLWTAARYRIPATFVIANNAQYQILKICAQQLDLPAARREQYVGLDLTGPEVDMVSLARSFGVQAHRVTDPDELGDRVRQSLAAGEPVLIDAAIAREREKRLNYG